MSDTLPRTKSKLKESGRTDWAFLNELSAKAQHPTGLDFRWYVRWDPDAKAGAGADVLVFEPFKVDLLREQYVFRYEDPELGMGSLREFEIRPTLKGMPTKVSVVYMNRKARMLREVVINLADPNAEPELLWSGKTGGLKGIDTEVKDGGAVRLKTGDLFEERNPRQVDGYKTISAGLAGTSLEFDDEKEALDFALKWFRNRQFAFTSATFTTIGLPRVRPWDVHWFKGLSKRWDGQYMLTGVKHRFARGSGYGLALDANKLRSAESFPQGRIEPAPAPARPKATKPPKIAKTGGQIGGRRR